MASHKPFLLVLFMVAVIVIYGSVSSNPKPETNTIDLIDIGDYNLDQKLDDLIQQFQNVMTKNIENHLDVDQAQDDIKRIGDDVKDGSDRINSVFDRIDFLESDGVTGDIVGIKEYENSMLVYDKILLKSDELKTSLEGYLSYVSFFMEYDEIGSLFISKKNILETYLTEKRNEDAVQVLDEMIDFVDQQINLVEQQTSNEIVDIPEVDMFLNDRIYYKKSLEAFRDDIKKVVADPKINREEAFAYSDEAYKEYIKNSFTTSQLRQGYDMWYEINVNGRLRELQELIVEYDATK